MYEQSFQPLWAPELVKSYFDLLTQTQSLRKFLDQARAALNANPEDLNAMARVFYYYQQQGKLDAAQQTVTAFRLHKEAEQVRVDRAGTLRLRSPAGRHSRLSRVGPLLLRAVQQQRHE